MAVTTPIIITTNSPLYVGCVGSSNKQPEICKITNKKQLNKDDISIEEKMKSINNYCDVGLIDKPTRDKKISDLIDNI